jgi:dihydroxy-acid dehydratase
MSDVNPTLRSRQWFTNTQNPSMTALYLERFLNYGLTRGELQSGRPIVGIAQTGSDLVPCNRHHLQLAERVRDGIRDAGGIPMEFPVHPLQETGKRPTAALDRNLAYLGLVEVLFGYPLDGVVLTTGCDKTTPASLMAAATVGMPAIVLSGGPMLDGHYQNRLAGSGTIVWEARELLAAGKIDRGDFIDLVASSTQSAGHCNTMGTALSMNSLAEALGMSLPGCAAIPAPYRERAQMAYESGQRIVAMILEDLTPAKIMTRAAFENAIVVAAAIGGSTNCVPHLIAIARHLGVPLDLNDWERVGHPISLLVNCQPAGEYLGEGYHRAGGVPAVMGELLLAGKIDPAPLTVNGRSIGENVGNARSRNHAVIRPYDDAITPEAGFLVLRSNFFDSAIMKTSVISTDFRTRFLSNPADPNAYVAHAVVFDGPEDYHARINDPALNIDEHAILVIRNCGPIGYPGSAEVVNMTPPDALVKRGITTLPCMGDGRQSGTAYTPSILHVCPEAAVGGGLALLQTGDELRIDLERREVNVLLPQAEIDARRRGWTSNGRANQTPWQQIFRDEVGQLETGFCLEPALAFRDVVHTMGLPRDSH